MSLEETENNRSDVSKNGRRNSNDLEDAFNIEIQRDK